MFTITITGIKPLGVQSTRFIKGHAYQDPRMREYKDNIRSNLLANIQKDYNMYAKGTPISVHLSFTFKCKDGKLRVRPHTTKPDCDNLSKGVLDACNKVLWVDDSQIATLRVTKHWGELDGIEIHVERIY